MLRSARLILLFLLPFSGASWTRGAAVPVTLAPGGGLLRDGKPYFIKGAGAHEHYEELVRRGGNSIRTWSERELPDALSAAEKLGLTVCAGVWLEPECSWFSYSKPEQCDKQLERVRRLVREHRDRPALLLWGLGNEAEGDGSNEAYWRQLNRLAKMVHEEDPAHPTLTAVAGLSAEKAAGLNRHTPDLDLIGINTYAALVNLRDHLVKVGWTRPWVVTEFGPRGFWESPRTPWDTPVEQTSTEKAAMIRRNYERTIAPGGLCAGSYIFIWGQKQEATATWFGVFTQEGGITATADVLQELWSGKGPANRAPAIARFQSGGATLKPGAEFSATVEAEDADGDALEYRWAITDDQRRRGAGGREVVPPEIPGLLEAEGGKVSVRAPQKAGAYRLFVFVSDGRGHVATANAPFRVEP